MRHKVLITAGGGPAALGFTKAALMAGHDVKLVDCDKHNLARAWPVKGKVIPRCDNPKYLEAVCEEAQSCDVIHVPSDAELEVLSEHRETLPCKFLWPSKEAMKISRDKWLTYTALNRNKVRVPPSYLVPDHLDIAHDLHGEIWLRARVGAGGKAAIRSPNLLTSITWTKLHSDSSFMCAKVLSKKTTTHVSLWKNGEPLVGQGRQRGRWELGDRAISGVTGQTGIGRTVRDRTLANLAYKAINAIESSPPNGFYAVDCVLDDNDIPHVTEINAGRPFTTASEFFARLGLNLADLYIRAASGENPPLPTERESPLPEGWLYIRGMDVNPILIHEKDL